MVIIIVGVAIVTTVEVVEVRKWVETEGMYWVWCKC